MTFELTVLLVNLALMFIYTTLIQPLLLVTYRKTSQSKEIETYHKKFVLKLIIVAMIMLGVFLLAVYTQSVSLLVAIFVILLYMMFTTLYRVGVYHKQRVPKLVNDESDKLANDTN